MIGSLLTSILNRVCVLPLLRTRVRSLMDGGRLIAIVSSGWLAILVQPVHHVLLDCTNLAVENVDAIHQERSLFGRREPLVKLTLVPPPMCNGGFEHLWQRDEVARADVLAGVPPLGRRWESPLGGRSG